MKTVTRVVRALLALSLLASAAACTKRPTRTPEQVVVLNTPTPPARVTIPVQLTEPDPEPVPSPPATAAAPPPSNRPRPDTTAAKPTTPAAAPAAPETPAAPVLQTTVDVGALEQRTNSLLKEAQGNLDRTRYSDIGVQARAQYDLAKSFIRTAFRALRDKNYTYAEYLAAKAAAIAKELAKG